MKKLLLSTVLLLSMSVISSAQQSEIFVTKGIAIKGYDPVAFFAESKPVKGSEEFSYKWKEAIWLFSSQINLDNFKENPEKYAPQYGGYCAYGTADNHKAPTETDTWTIVNGKLYFNYNTKVKKIWLPKQDAFIIKADENWLLLKDKE